MNFGSAVADKMAKITMTEMSSTKVKPVFLIFKPDFYLYIITLNTSARCTACLQNKQMPFGKP